MVNIDVTVSDVNIGDVIGHDYNDDPVTLADKVADKLMHKIVRGNSWDDINRRVRDIRDEEIRARVGTEIADAMTAGFRRTNSFGEVIGEEITLRSVIAEQVEAALRQVGEQRWGGRDDPSALRKAIAAEVRNTLTEDFKQAMADEIERVRQCVRDTAAELIAAKTVK